jgi:hypothetical protein
VSRVLKSLGGRWPLGVVAAGWALLVQSGGCWCVPPEPESFNTFPRGGPPSLLSYCREWALSECPHVESCQPALFTALGGAAGCPLAMERTCDEDLSPWMAAVAAGRAWYDPLLARGCLDVRVHRDCGEADPPPCNEFLSGVVGTHQPCRQGLECVRGHFCSGGPDSCGLCLRRATLGEACWGPGTCQPPLRCKDGLCQDTLSTGALCAADPTACPDGTVCAGAYPPLATCVLPGLNGADCSVVPCRQGLTCVLSLAGPTCLPPVPAGQDCDPLGEYTAACDGLGARTYCDPVEGLCRPVRVVAGGESCGASSVCRADHVCQGRVCRPLPQVGQPCAVSSAGEDPCYRSRCVRSTCQPASVVGEPCDGGCVGLSCVGGTCGVGGCDGGQSWDAWVPPRG